jgi:dTDP-4-dehydrorhamnose 3,5-epimerase
MQITELALPGAFLVAPERQQDERGYFARTWCREEFASHGLMVDFVQCNTSFNTRHGTLRGMHFQRAPHAETKLVRCTRGAMFDVLLDLRSDAATFCRWQAIELTADNGLAV